MTSPALYTHPRRRSQPLQDFQPDPAGTHQPCRTGAAVAQVWQDTVLRRGERTRADARPEPERDGRYGRLPQTRDRGNAFSRTLEDKLITRWPQYINRHGEDMPVARNGAWKASAAQKDAL